MLVIAKKANIRSHPVRGAWIEIVNEKGVIEVEKGSHPVRGAWIEMRVTLQRKHRSLVASRKGCVD